MTDISLAQTVYMWWHRQLNSTIAADLSVHLQQPVGLEVFPQFLVQQTVQQGGVAGQRTKAIVVREHLFPDPVHSLHNCITQRTIECVNDVGHDAPVGGPGAELTGNDHGVSGLPTL